MKNLFCRICRGRFNLKYPPAAVDSEKKETSSHTITVRINKSGEISENICWDCEDTLLGFHKSVGEHNDEEEEPVVVDDDEILYTSLEKQIGLHRLSKESNIVTIDSSDSDEIIKVDSSDSENEEIVRVPKEDLIQVEPANTVIGVTTNCPVGEVVNKEVAVKENVVNKPHNSDNTKKYNSTRFKVFESMRCPLCPYLSGIEYEVVYHIRQTHPQYTGEYLRLNQPEEGDPALTTRITFAHLFTFFECKACGKVHDRFWAHRKHITSHDRKNVKKTANDKATINNNEVLISHDKQTKVQTSKRALDSLGDISNAKKSKTDQPASKNKNSVNIKTSAVQKASKSHQNNAKNHQAISVNKKTKSKGFIRKQQAVQARREKRRLKKEDAKKTQASTKPVAVISKATFKIPQQPAPRASSIVKQSISQPRHTCKVCCTTFLSFITWNLHMLKQHDQEEFAKTDSSDDLCSKCNKRFASASLLNMHYRLSHRRKNRLVEINGNDNEEICRQTLTPKKSKEQNSDDTLPPSNEDSVVSNKTTSTSNSTLICQYCGKLFGNSIHLGMHETFHDELTHAKRVFLKKPQA